LEQVEDLEPVDITDYKYVNVWLEAVRLLADHFKGGISVRGNCDQAPFSLASMMRGAQNWMMDIYDEENEPLVTGLLEYCTDVTCQFIRHMAETGADIVSNGDSVAGPAMISPGMYERYALPYEKKAAETAHQAGLPYVIHICGNTEAILDLVRTNGADGVELDYLTDTHKIYDAFHGRVTLFGTIDPSGILARETVDEVERAVEDLLAVYGQEDRFVLNSGCAIPATAPSENIHAMIETARSYSK
jgi:uroporphyrinogen decarboxylase